MRLIQVAGKGGRRAGIVEDSRIRLFKDFRTVYDLAVSALGSGAKLASDAGSAVGGDTLDYDEIYSGESGWRILPPIDHPAEPARCMVTGTGLSHMGSASNRQAMHAATEAQLTDSMKMFQWGVEGGRPEAGNPGVSPEWFYKGTGGILRGHGEPLEVPAFSEDGGDEPELAGIYVIDGQGMPCRIGIAVGNEFSDHVFEKKNYLYLAASKLRDCSLGPELVVDPDFSSVKGEASVLRGSGVVWSKPLHTGESVMCHSLANIEHHHFKFAPHRHPGDVHIHFFGASAFSFGDGLRLSDGDVMKVEFEGYGRPLLNPVRIQPKAEELVSVRPA
jgi:hypothetical protein